MQEGDYFGMETIVGKNPGKAVTVKAVTEVKID
jgi:hypothetical protein